MVEPFIADKNKLSVIYSGIDLKKQWNPVGKRSLHEELEVAEGIPIVANISAIAPHKDYFTFVAVAEYVLKKMDCRFLIIGADGGEEKVIKKQITDKNLREHIIFAGFRTDIPFVLSNLSALLFTSKTEGLGTTVLDAFANGTPVIATMAGGIPEIVRHNETGMTAPVGNVEALSELLLRVLTDESLKNRLIKNAANFVKDFSKEKMAEKTLKVYSQVMNI
jgi:glycosyltransferase involved in cell wall biosynthesis